MAPPGELRTAASGQEHHRSLICPDSILAQQHPTCSHSQTRDIRVLSSCYREIERPVTPKQEPPPRQSLFCRWPRSAWPAACFQARCSSTSPAPPTAATSRVRAWKQLTVPKESTEEQLAAWDRPVGYVLHLQHRVRAPEALQTEKGQGRREPRCAAPSTGHSAAPEGSGAGQGQELSTARVTAGTRGLFSWCRNSGNPSDSYFTINIMVFLTQGLPQESS